MAELDRAIAAAPAVADVAILDLATRHAEALLRGDNLARDEDLGDFERAIVDFTEQFVFSVSTVSDEQVDAMLTYMTADDLHRFINALFVHEMTYRLELVTRKVLR